MYSMDVINDIEKNMYLDASRKLVSLILTF